MTGIDVVLQEDSSVLFFLLFSLNVTMAKNIVRWYEGDYQRIEFLRFVSFITTDMFTIKEYMSLFL